MNSNRLIVLSIGLALSFPQGTRAQSLDDYSALRTELDAMFEDLDKTKIITGLLLDYAVDLVDLSLFDGENMSDSSTVNYATLQYILYTISSAAPVSAPFQEVSVISDTLSARNLRTGHIPICVAAFDYNQIRADALTNNLINYDESNGGKVSDKYIGNTWVNPYTVNTVVAFSPLINTSTSWNVTFTYDDEYLFSNRIINNITIDFGDGLGYRPLSEGTYSISYPEPGEYEIRIKVYLWHNPDPLEARSFMIILPPAVSPSSAPIDPTAPDSLTFTSTQSYCGGTPRATVSINYAASHNKHIVKPFIVAEGIDPIRFNDSYVSGNFYRNKGFTNMDRFKNHMPADTSYYDIVYIDWEDSCAPLELNADILKQVIRFVNHEKTDSTQSLVLMGQSMGGLISRIALCQMEDDHESHYVSVFLSHDAPHLGANVPVGLLYLAQFLLNKVSGLSGITRFLLLTKLLPFYSSVERDIIYQDLIKLREAPSVKQMLYNYVDTTLTLVENNNSDYHQWQNNNYLKYPKGDGTVPFKSLSLSNGGNTLPSFSNGIASFNASFTASLVPNWYMGAFLLLYNPLESFLYLLPRHTTLDYEIQVKPYLNNNEQVFYYRHRLRKKFLWIPYSDKTIEEISRPSPPNGARMERIKSSVYRLDNLASVEYLSDSIGNSIPFVGSVYADYMIRNEFPFVPTASSLGYNRLPGYSLSEQDYNANFVGNTSRIQSTPFNSYFLKGGSSYHTSIDELVPNDVRVWFDTMKDLEIVGPTEGETGSRYKLSDTTITVSSWSTSPNSVASIDNQGILTVAEAPGKNYSPIITGKGLFNGNPFCLHKQINVNKTISDTCYYYLTVQSAIPLHGGDGEFMVSAHRLEDVPVIYLEEPVIEPPAGHGPDGGGLIPIPDTLVVLPEEPLDPIVPVSFYTWKLLRGTDSLVVWTLPSDSLHISVTAPENNNFIISFSGTDPDGYIIPTVSVPLHDTGFPHGAIIVGPTGILQVDDGDGNTSLIPVRGPAEEISLTVEVGDVILSYTHIPSQSEILEDLVKETSFVERLKWIEPWGKSPFMIIPYSITDNVTGTNTDCSFKFIFNPRINGNE